MQYFLAVAEVLHFGQAAKKLHISQPGLTQQIKSLERELGIPLFTRDGGVKLTPAGHAMQEEATEIIHRIDLMIKRLRRIGNGDTGVLRVLYTRSLPSSVTGAIVSLFRNEYPGVDIRAETAWTARNLELLRSGAYDAAFVQLPIDDILGIEAIVIGRMDFAAAIPAAHPLAVKEELSPGDLREVPFVYGPRDQAPGFYDAIINQLWGGGPIPAGQEEPDAERMLDAVAAGRGFTVLEHSRALILSKEGVVVRPFRKPRPYLTFGLAWADKSNDPVVKNFIDSCRTFATRKEILSQGRVY